MQRRHLLQAAASGLVLGPLSGAWAQVGAAKAAPAAAPFPRLRMLVPANAGGGWDQTGRALGASLQAASQVGEMEYENKGGKGGVLGLANFVERYSSDPLTLMVGGYVMVGSIALNRPQIDLSRVTPIARLTSELLVLVVPASSRHRSLHTFAEELKARTASMPIAGGGAGGVDHICAAMVGRAVNIDPAQLVYQPFSSGGEVLAAVASGKVAAAISGYGELKAGIMSGQVRALGISARRATYGVPSMREQGVNVELGNWRGVFAGNSLTPAQLGELREAVQKATLHPSWKETLTRNNWQASWLAGEELQRSIDFDLTSARVLVHMLKLKTA